MGILEFQIVWKLISALLTLLVGVVLLIFIRRRSQEKAKKSEPAGFWVRVICLGTDLAIIDILISFLAYRGSFVVAGYITILLTLSYFFFFWLFFAATPAMMLTRLKIVSQNGKPLYVWQVLVRLGMFAFVVVGWITMLFDKKDKRALHDMIAKTTVVFTEKEAMTEKNKVPTLRLVMLGMAALLLIYLIVFGLGEKLTKYTENNQITFIDLNQDTLVDGLTMDVNEDGKSDVFKYDLNNDYIVDFTTFDTDNDGVNESIDQNNDGLVDGFDFDKDNRIDIPIAKGQFFIWVWKVFFGIWSIGFIALLIFTIIKEKKK